MNIKEILKQKQFTFEKKYGQNFLTDTNLLASIVAKSGVDENSTVVEIGVGAGTLTGEIAKRVKKVYGFEVDKKLKPVLDETLKDYNNVEIIFNDIMKVNTDDIEKMIGTRYTVIANLPYYITTPILMKFIEEANLVDAIIVTVQKEVAERICAKSGTSDYGAITATINAIGDTEIIKYIDRTMFYPAPNVDSAVCKIVLNKDKYYIKDINYFRKLVKTSFLMRRKTLVNNLIKGYKISRQQCEEILTSLNLDVNVRGEELSSKDFIDLSHKLLEKGIL
ncbi:MAG: ribosomal RNA small subunit methyltransferase A [Clostridia bacterium]|nr:ribosomal RNA small subunit methyltransferase A [Clostridia bacterium]